MENKVKTYIENEYKNIVRLINSNSPLAKTYGKDTVKLSMTRCYGIVMFAINELFDDYNEELAKWWDNEMLTKFKELERR